MEACICAVLNRYDSENWRYRVVNFTPGIKKPVTEVSRAKLVELLNDGIEIPNVSTNKGQLYYQGRPLDNCIVNIEEGKYTRKCVLYGVIYNDDGDHELILVKGSGRIERKKFSEFFKADKSRIVNIKYIETESYSLTGKIPVLRFKDSTDYKQYLLTDLDDKPVRGLNISKNKVYPPVEEDPFYTAWLDSDDYMSQTIERGLPYNFNYHKLGSFLDTSKPIVNVPRGTRSVVFETNQPWPAHDYTIRIPTGVSEIRFNNTANLNNLKIVYEDVEHTSNIVISGLDTYLIHHPNERLTDFLPDSISHLYGVGEFDINELNSFPNLSILDTCYQGTEIPQLPNDELVLPPTLKIIANSFFNIVYTGSNRLKIIFPPSLQRIRASFSNLKNIDFDFSSATNLEALTSESIIMCDTESLDLSNCNLLSEFDSCIKYCDKLVTLKLPSELRSLGYGSISNLKSLSHIILPPNLEYVHYSFDKCKSLHEISIPPKVHSISAYFEENTKIIIEPRPLIQQGFFSSISYSHPSIEIGNVEELAYESFEGMPLDIISFSNVKKLNICTFKRASGTKLDMYNWDVTGIPHSCFINSTLKEIALPKHTKVIGDSAFELTDRLEKLFIPSTVTSASKKSFVKMGNINVAPLTVYITKDSPVLQYMDKQVLKILTFENDQEAYDNWAGIVTQSSAKAIAKAKMFLSFSNDEIMQEIVSDEYISNVQILTDLYKSLSTNYTQDITPISLDMHKIKGYFTQSNLIDLIYRYFGMASDLYLYVQRNSDSYTQGAKNQNQLTNQFKVLANLITQNSDTDDYYNSFEKLSELWAKLSERFDINTHEKCHISMIYSDKYSSISRIQFHLEYTQGRNKTTHKNIGFWFIRVGKNIVYYTMDENLNNIKSIHSNLSVLAKRTPDDLDELSNLHKSMLKPLNKVLQVNDTITFTNLTKNSTSTIKGCKIPYKLNQYLMEVIDNQFIVLCGTMRLLNNKTETAYLLNSVTGAIIKTSCKPRSSSDEFVQPFSLHYITIESIEEYGKYNKSTSNDIKNLLLSTDGVSDWLKQIVDEYAVLNDLKNSEGAYDELEPSLEWEIGKLLVESQINEIEPLNLIFIQGILETRYFQYSERSESTISGYRPITTYTLKDNTNVNVYGIYDRRRPVNIIEYAYKYYITLTDPTGKRLPSAEAGWISCYYPADVVSFISHYYDPSGEYISSVDTNIHKREDFMNVWTSSLSYGNKYCGIYVCKASGAIFFSVDDSYCGIKNLFRFRDMTDAVKFCRIFFNETKTLSTKNKSMDLHDSIFAIYKVFDVENSEFLGMLGSIYHKVLHGYPNGYIINGQTGELYNLVAKQPSILGD